MKVSELIETLLDYDGNDSVTFYHLKDNVLTNCQLEDVNSYGMGIEFTIQDTSELLEDFEDLFEVYDIIGEIKNEYEKKLAEAQAKQPKAEW